MLVSTYLLGAFALGGAHALVSPRADRVIKYLPIGDSITEKNCWRPLVWDQIVDAGLDGIIEFSGSMTTNPWNCKANKESFVNRHEGHSSHTSVQVADLIVDSLNYRTPDIAQILLGANDVVQGVTTDETFEAFDFIVKAIRDTNEKAIIIIAKAIPRVKEKASQAKLDLINDRIDGWAADSSTEDSPIYVVDSSKQGGYQTSWLRDKIHPNDEGERYLADLFGPKVIDAANEILGRPSRDRNWLEWMYNWFDWTSEKSQ